MEKLQVLGQVFRNSVTGTKYFTNSGLYPEKVPLLRSLPVEATGSGDPVNGTQSSIYCRDEIPNIILLDEADLARAQIAASLRSKFVLSEMTDQVRHQEHLAAASLALQDDVQHLDRIVRCPVCELKHTLTKLLPASALCALELHRRFSLELSAGTSEVVGIHADHYMNDTHTMLNAPAQAALRSVASGMRGLTTYAQYLNFWTPSINATDNTEVLGTWRLTEYGLRVLRGQEEVFSKFIKKRGNKVQKYCGFGDKVLATSLVFDEISRLYKLYNSADPKIRVIRWPTLQSSSEIDRFLSEARNAKSLADLSTDFLAFVVLPSPKK